MIEAYGETQFVEPVKRPGRKGAGRKPDPNPFIDDVRCIVGQTDKTGRPLTAARAFTLEHERNETLAQRSARIRRFLTRAGKEVAKEVESQFADSGMLPYSIGMNIVAAGDGEGEGYVVKFWDRRAAR